MEKTVVELFAGVGGFRVGLNNIKKINKKGHAVEHGNFDFVWSNQWEPSTKSQPAFECYKARFNDTRYDSNIDISLVEKSSIPNHTLLCGGFPCQDYSVAHSLSKEKGIEGKKGVLWWQINEILSVKKPNFVLLENVDRLLKSPSKQRGRDFGIILKCFANQGYNVEWRVINAADYGHPQRRRRTFIFASKNNTCYSKKLCKSMISDIFNKNGIFAKSFPIIKINDTDIKSNNLDGYDDLVDFSNKFKFTFENSGVLIKNTIYTIKTEPKIKKAILLKDIVQKEDVPSFCFLNDKEIKQYKYLRGSKKIPRKKPNGEDYLYSEGAMSPYDSLDLPGRTMLTSEGTTNRSTHIIKDPKTSKLRNLTPIECERLNEFPDNWTDTGMQPNRRYFMMGNALVCGIIRKLGIQINKIIDSEN